MLNLRSVDFKMRFFDNLVLELFSIDEELVQLSYGACRAVFMWIRIAICDAIRANCESNVKLIYKLSNPNINENMPPKKLI